MLRDKALKETISVTLLRVRGWIEPAIGPVTNTTIAQIRIALELNLFLDLKAQTMKSAENAPIAIYPNSKIL